MKLRIPLLVLALSLVLLILFRLFPSFMDTIYSSFLYVVIAQGVSFITALIPFSLAEILIYLLFLIVVFFLVRGILLPAFKPCAEVKVIWKKNLHDAAYLACGEPPFFFLAAGFITTGFPWKTTLVIRNNRYTRQIWSIWLKRLPVKSTGQLRLQGVTRKET